MLPMFARADVENMEKRSGGRMKSDIGIESVMSNQHTLAGAGTNGNGKRVSSRRSTEEIGSGWKRFGLPAVILVVLIGAVVSLLAAAPRSGQFTYFAAMRSGSRFSTGEKASL